MGSDVNTVRETTSARAMDVAIASGDRSERFFLPVLSSQWDEWERKMVSVGVMRAVDVPKRAREFFLFLVDASRRRGE